MLLEKRDSGRVQEYSMARDAKIGKQQRRIATLKKHKKALQKECAELKGMVPWHTSRCRSLETSLMQETLQHNAF